jgi:hypothetical protein
MRTWNSNSPIRNAAGGSSTLAVGLTSAVLLEDAVREIAHTAVAAVSSHLLPGNENAVAMSGSIFKHRAALDHPVFALTNGVGTILVNVSL